VQPITVDLFDLGGIEDDRAGLEMATGRGEVTTIETGPCQGETCNERDPLLSPCVQDAIVVEEVSRTVFRWQDDWQPRQVIVQKLYSESCDATWVNAYVPDGTFLFIREQEFVEGTQPVRGLTQADSTGYSWVQSHMANGNVATQACVSLPVLSIGVGHDLYDHICTDFSQPA